jgi:hypothetical protein
MSFPYVEGPVAYAEIENFVISHGFQVMFSRQPFFKSPNASLFEADFLKLAGFT